LENKPAANSGLGNGGLNIGLINSNSNQLLYIGAALN